MPLVFEQTVAAVRGEEKVGSAVPIHVADRKAGAHEALKTRATLRAGLAPASRHFSLLEKRAGVLRPQVRSKLRIDARRFLLVLRRIGDETRLGVLPWREANGLRAHL